VEIEASEVPQHAETTRNRRKSNKDGLALTKSGRISLVCNDINTKFDSTYRNPDNEQKLLGRFLNLGQACGIVGMALYGAAVPGDSAGYILRIYKYLHILRILRILNIYTCLSDVNAVLQPMMTASPSSNPQVGMLFLTRRWMRFFLAAMQQFLRLKLTV
jgi:hypothetical protein